MTDFDLTPILQTAERACADAAGVRAALRKVTKPGDEEREYALAAARTAIDDAMTPIRSLIGRMPWDPIPVPDERALRKASKALGAERRRIKKMQRS